MSFDEDGHKEIAVAARYLGYLRVIPFFMSSFTVLCSGVVPMKWHQFSLVVPAPVVSQPPAFDSSRAHRCSSSSGAAGI